MLEEAREGIATLLGAKTGGMNADQLIFTSGGTEANNLALMGMVSAASRGHKEFTNKYPDIVKDVLVSGIEHPSIIATADEMLRRGFQVRFVSPTDSEGRFNEDFYRWFDELPFLVSVMLANNETGIIQPVSAISAACRKCGILMHTDAVQAAGKIPVNFAELGVDAMTVAPHKFHGPLGIGALLLKHGVPLKPLHLGGFQQGALRPGTENVPLVVGFFEALRLAHEELPKRAADMRTHRDELERLLLADLPEMIVIGQGAARLPNTSCVSFPGVNRQALVMALDMAGVACSTGSACASGSSEPSPTLVAMGLSPSVVEGSIRLSLGAFTTDDEVAKSASRIVKTVKHLQRIK
jgi:cysteine desulfurase